MGTLSRMRLLLISFFFAAANAFAADETIDFYEFPPEQETPAYMEEVVITGTWPGPRMWKVSKGGHVLWLLGTLDPLPKKMSWESKEVEAIIKDAQEVLNSEPSISPNASLFGKLRLYMQWRGMRKNDHDGVLKDFLPSELYARFNDLKIKYAPKDDGIERLRPALAGGRLYFKAVDASGLATRNVVNKTVIKLAKKHRVKVHRAELKINDAGGLLNELKEVPRESEIRCLESTMTRLEKDIGMMAARANAWAIGNLDALRKVSYTENASSCWDILASSPRIKALMNEAQNAWMTAAESALDKNTTTLALWPISDVLKQDGVLLKFRAKGYAVEEP